MQTVVLDFGIEICLDPQHSRITHGDQKKILINTTVATEEQCQDFNVNVQFVPHDVFRPLAFDMHFEVLDLIPDSEGLYL